MPNLAHLLRLAVPAVMARPELPRKGTSASELRAAASNLSVMRFLGGLPLGERAGHARGWTTTAPPGWSRCMPFTCSIVTFLGSSAFTASCNGRSMVYRLVQALQPSFTPRCSGVRDESPSHTTTELCACACACAMHLEHVQGDVTANPERLAPTHLPHLTGHASRDRPVPCLAPTEVRGPQAAPHC